MKIHDFRLNYYIKHCAVILLTAWCFICLMEMPCRLSDSSDDSYIQMIAQYRNGLFDKIMNAC